MGRSFFTGTDTELYEGSINFAALVNETPGTFGLTVQQTTAYAALNAAYAAAYIAARNPETRTQGRVATKNAAREPLRAAASDLAKIIDGTPSVSAEQKINLGLAVRRVPSPVPPPKSAPDVDVLGVSGRTAKVRLHDAAGNRRGRAPGATGASVLVYVGPTPPSDPSLWTFNGTTGKTVVDVSFDPDVPAGATVWFTACWLGTRMQAGPMANPVSANLPGGLTLAA